MEINQVMDEFYSHVLKGKEMNWVVKNHLDIDSNGGQNFLPKKVSDRIVFEYPESNKLRQIMTVTTIRGLDQPIVSSAADEFDLQGKSVTFQPYRDRITVNVSETVFLGSNNNIHQVVETAMQTELNKREINRMLTITPTAGEEHMSLYTNGIKEITNTNLYEGIKAALKDLPESIRDNASVIVNLEDYNSIVKHLGTIGLGALGANPDLIFNRKLLIVDKAIKPIVGDFSCLQLNYDTLRIEDGKDVLSGVITFVLVAIFDIRVLIPQAFRIVNI